MSSRELDFIEKKVSRWNSLGHFKKALLSGDHAEELKSHQDAVQTALEETQVCHGFLSVVRLGDWCR